MFETLLEAPGWIWGKGKRRTPLDQAPGTLIRHPDAQPTTMRVIAYGPDSFEERESATIPELSALMESFPVVWADAQGLGTIETLEALGDLFGAHRLTMEDIVNVPQRAKFEEHSDHLFATLREMCATTDGGVVVEQVSYLIGRGYLVSVAETPVDGYGPVRERIRRSRGRIRAMGSDYLAYALIDAVIDGYFPVIEGYGARLESMENEIVSNKSSHTKDMISEIHAIKRDLVGLHRIVTPFREAAVNLARDGSPHIEGETLAYYRDARDHVTRALDLIESFRALAEGLTDFYLAVSSHRLNDVIKVLTIISTIFIPLSFIAGVFGMNFDPAASPWNMPELNWYWGYPTALGAMTLISVGLIIYFRKKGWL